MSILEQLESEKYISVETFKKDGSSVRTPVWFVIRDQAIVVITRRQTGKFKRLKNNNRVNLAVCSMKGDVKGEWVSGTATILVGDKIRDAIRWRDKRYGFIARVAKFMNKSKGELCAFSINLD